jgi:hypothetical protein
MGGIPQMQDPGESSGGSRWHRSFKKPFRNCLFMANECVLSLQAALRAEQNPIYYEYADRVWLATDNWHQRPKSAWEYHCIAMLQLRDHCIIMDPFAHTGAIKLPVGEVTELPMASYFKFVYVAVGNVRLLVNYHGTDLDDDDESYSTLSQSTSAGCFSYGDLFRPIRGGFEGGVVNMAWPCDRYLGRSSSRRFIRIQQPWDDKGDRFTGADLYIDVINRRLTLNSISEEWLNRRENASILGILHGLKNIEFEADGSSLMLDMSGVQQKFNKNMTKKLKVFDRLCTALGLPQGELTKIANVIREFWREEVARGVKVYKV